MNKYVVVGKRKVGKTTLVNKLLEYTNKSVIGFQTLRLVEVSDENGLHPLYIYPINKKPIFDEKHCLGYCGKGVHKVNNDTFNTMGVKLIEPTNESELIIIDEIGFMEENATAFKEKVFEVLKMKNPVLIMLKDKPGIKFLEDIKNLNDIELIEMDMQNRDTVLEYLKEKLNKG